MTDTPDPPAVDFSNHKRSASLRDTYHALWPHLVEQGRVLQADLAEKTAADQDNYSESSLRKTILPQIADVLAEEDIIDVQVPEEKRKQKEDMVYWVLAGHTTDGDTR